MTTPGDITEPCRDPYVQPIVFVPGIMGSRLKQTGSGLTVWDPVTRQFLGQYAAAGPAARRQLVIGPPGTYFQQNFLSVDFANAEWMAERVPGPAGQEKLDRGWGGLVWDFYGPFLIWLENQFVSTVTSQDSRMRCVIVEAFAEPYNWAGDNGASAGGLDRRVAQAISDSRAKHADVDATFLDPIVISHSMGGLVTRAFAKNGSNAGNVRAVIHGALPTQGAPAAYKRMMAGFEGAAALALGLTGAQVTAVGANSPGVLELLPSQFHEDRNGNRQWLKFSIEGSTFFELPNSDPFAEIYSREDVWWRPVRKEAIDPANPDPLAQEQAWISYLANLQTAHSFHAQLGTGASGFHPNTYMLYSDSPNFLAWDQVEWRGGVPEQTGLSEPEQPTIFGIPVPIDVRTTEDQDGSALIPALQAAMRSQPEQDLWEVSPGDGSPLGAIFDLGSDVPDDAAGIRRRGTAFMQNLNAPGDGTVHAGSGIRVPRTIENEATRTASGGLAGYAHDQCFVSEDVRQQVATWLLEEISAQL